MPVSVTQRYCCNVWFTLTLQLNVLGLPQRYELTLVNVESAGSSMSSKKIWSSQFFLDSQAGVVNTRLVGDKKPVNEGISSGVLKRR